MEMLVKIIEKWTLSRDLNKSDLTEYLIAKHVIKDDLHSLQLSQSRKFNKGIGVELVDGISLQLYLL